MAKPQYDPAQLKRTIRSWSDQSVRLARSGVEVPSEFEAEVSHPAWPCAVQVHVLVSPDQGPVLSGVRALAENTEPVSYREAADLLKTTSPVNVLVSTLTAQATSARVTWGLSRQIDRDDPQYDDKLEALIEEGRGLDAAVWPEVQPRRRRMVTQSLLEEVAKVYREAHTAGEPPTAAVAKHFQTSHSTATRWVTMARKQGTLGPAQGTKPGEAATPST